MEEYFHNCGEILTWRDKISVISLLSLMKVPPEIFVNIYKQRTICFFFFVEVVAPNLLIIRLKIRIGIASSNGWISQDLNCGVPKRKPNVFFSPAPQYGEPFPLLS